MAASLLATVGCGKSSTVPPPTSFTCVSDADCRVSCVQRDDCCGHLCTCKTPYHSDELDQIQASNRASCPKPSECPVASCTAPTRRFLPTCTAGRCSVREVSLPDDGDTSASESGAN